MTNTLSNIYGSLTATALAEIATLPICTLKTNYQNTNSTSIVKTAQTVYRMRGIRGFYAASIPAIMGQMFSTSSKYVLYRWLDTNPDYPVKNRFVNGITAGITSSLLTHPMDVVKVHLQMKEPVLSQIRVNGLGLFYRGYSKTFSKIVVASSLFFPMYDTIRERVDNPILASAVSGIISTTVMQPVDYLKTRHMMGLSLYNGVNPLHYYKGYTLNLMRVVPHFVITMWVIEFITKRSD